METEYFGFGSLLMVFSTLGCIVWFKSLERWKTGTGAILSGAVVLTLSIAAAFWCAYVYSGMGYGTGKRFGVVVKVSASGFFWETTEGSLVLGTTQDSVWDFTIPDQLVSQLTDLDAGKKVVIEYDEAFMAVPWKGRSRYRMKSVHAAE